MGSINIERTEFTAEEKAIILAAHKEGHPPHVYKRLLVLKLKVADGMRSAETGRIAGMHAKSVNRVIVRFKRKASRRWLVCGITMNTAT